MYVDSQMFICFMDIWNTLQTLGILHDHLVHFVIMWYIFSSLGIHEKSGNPGRRAKIRPIRSHWFQFISSRLGN
jgi:hypothetical protein